LGGGYRYHHRDQESRSQAGSKRRSIESPRILPSGIHQDPVEHTIRIEPQPLDNTWLVTVRSSTSDDTHVVGAGSEAQEALLEAAILIEGIMKGRNKP
jgi:hypothetical protein